MASAQAEDGGVVTYNTVSYEYDTRGNILSKVYSLNGETVDTITYTYGNTVWKDQLTSFDGVSIDYDEIGNPTNWVNGETLSWQHGRQLASYAKDGKTISYTYNSDGIRTSKTVGNVTTTYNVVDGTLRSLTQGNHTLRFFDNQILYNDTSYWFVTNAQNDVIGIIDQNGDYVVEYTYDSWGNITSQTDSELARLNPFRYRGYIYDEETGFYYCQSRYYDPEVGRWLNADGYLTTGYLSTQHNMYVYCGNNAVCNVDYSGCSPKELFDTMDEAARDAAVFLGEKSFSAHVEYATLIYELSIMDFSLAWVRGVIDFGFLGTYTYYYPVITVETKKKYVYFQVTTDYSPISVTLPDVIWLLNDKCVASLHTHPFGSGSGTVIYSNEDKQVAKNMNTVCYVHGPLGQLYKYEPWTGEQPYSIDDSLPHSPYRPWEDETLMEWARLFA